MKHVTALALFGALVIGAFGCRDEPPKNSNGNQTGTTTGNQGQSKTVGTNKIVKTGKVIEPN